MRNEKEGERLPDPGAADEGDLLNLAIRRQRGSDEAIHGGADKQKVAVPGAVKSTKRISAPTSTTAPSIWRLIALLSARPRKPRRRRDAASADSRLSDPNAGGGRDEGGVASGGVARVSTAAAKVA